MDSKWKPSRIDNEVAMTRCKGNAVEVRKMLTIDKLQTFWQNFKSFHHRIMMRYLRKRGWVVFYLEPEHRICAKGTCWLELYSAEQKRTE